VGQCSQADHPTYRQFRWSTVLTVISKQGDKWVWKQTAAFPDGREETSIDTVTVADGGNTLVHYVTDRVHEGRKLADIRNTPRRANDPPGI